MGRLILGSETINRLIIGCGYLGKRVALRWLEQGDQVFALTRSPEHARRLEEQRIAPIVGDVMDPGSLSSLPNVDSCLYAVGFDRSGSYSKQQVYVTGLGHVLKALASKIRRLTYISSTSVYGQDHGELVDEESPCEPNSEGGRICLEAERLVRDSQIPATILRLSGIYGPQRLIGRTEQLRQRQPLSGRPDAWLNLIHVDDAASCVLTVADQTQAAPLYLVSDERPVQRGEFYGTFAQLVGAPPPLFAEPDAPSLGKRCQSQRLWEEFKIERQFPTIVEGLPQALDASTT
ncbi:MAG: SDR family oxidoreductase [Planctomycetaceae bacterium]|nr:SDR family oxidoreductase [Planctomycetaceae bacterium]